MKKDLIIPFLILLALTLGCSKLREIAGTSGNSGGSSNSNVEIKPNDTRVGEYAPSSDPKADIERLAERFLTVKSFRATMNAEGKTPMKTDLEFAAPDRYHVKIANSMEVIIIGKTSYMKMGDKWRKSPVPLGSTIADMRAAFDKEGLKWFSDVKFSGEESANGKPAYLYTYRGKMPDNSGEYDSKLWIGKHDGLPVRIEAAYKTGNLRSMTVDYVYDTPITIEPPVD